MHEVVTWLLIFAGFLISSLQSHFVCALLLMRSCNFMIVMYTLKNSLVIECLPCSV